MNVDCGIPRILKGTDGHLLTAPSPESGNNVEIPYPAARHRLPHKPATEEPWRHNVEDNEGWMCYRANQLQRSLDLPGLA